MTQYTNALVVLILDNEVAGVFFPYKKFSAPVRNSF